MKYPLMRSNFLRADLDEVIDLLKEDDPILTSGPKVRKFEQEWSQWLGVKHSVFVNSGSSSNLLSLAALKIIHPDGGEVITPPLGWISDVAAVIQNGFTPIFADINPQTLSMDEERILEKVTDKTRAVILTHVQGFNGLTDHLLSELEKRNILLIEDVCESHGATHQGRRLGSFGWISNFSFYYAHHMSSIEGGMVCTNDSDTYEKIRMLRAHGMVRESTDQNLKDQYQREHPDLNPDFIFAYPAYNMRPTEIGAILGSCQLKRLDDNVIRRTENLHIFLENIDPVRFRTDFKLEGSSNYALNLILKQPDDLLAERLMKQMRAHEVEFRRGSAGGGNQTRQPYLADIIPADTYKTLPETDHIHFYGFYIGNYPTLTQEEVLDICAIINAA